MYGLICKSPLKSGPHAFLYTSRLKRGDFVPRRQLAILDTFLVVITQGVGHVLWYVVVRSQDGANILQCTRQPPKTKNYPAQNVDSDKVNISASTPRVVNISTTGLLSFWNTPGLWIHPTTWKKPSTTTLPGKPIYFSIPPVKCQANMRQSSSAF